MKSKLVSRVPYRFGVTASLLLAGAFATAAGCSSSDDGKDIDKKPLDGGPVDSGGRDSTVPVEDGGDDDDDAAPQDDAGSDAGNDADTDADAGHDAGPQGCAAFPGAAFCDDFDSPDAITVGKTKWDFLEQSTQPILTLSTAQKVSAPQSLLTQVIDGQTPGVKFAKTITKANFTEVTWDYDVFLENVGTGAGFFLDDFQFTDSGKADNFGFRVVLIAEAASIKEVKVEHNADAILKDYVIEPPFAAGTVKLGQWHHVSQHVKFTFASGAVTDSVDYEIKIDGSSAFKKSYPGLSRAQAAFARFAGMAFVFDKPASAGLKIFWDNQKVDIQ